MKIDLLEKHFVSNNEMPSNYEIVGTASSKFYNNTVQQRFMDIQKILFTLENSGKLKKTTNKQLKQYIEDKNSDKEETTDIYLFKDHIEKYISEKTKRTTKEAYEYTLNKISKYADLDFLTFQNINYNWLKGFEKSMEDLSINTRSIHFRNIRSVFNDAIDEEKISLNNYPFRRFKIKSETTMKRSLTVQELVTLRDYDCEKYLERYR